MIKILKVSLLSVCLLLVSTSIFALPTHYSRVYFFGDSLSDVGNNLDGLSDQAPLVNVSQSSRNDYQAGKMWVQYFVQDLANDGYIPQAATTIVSSRALTAHSGLANEGESIDYAYSGDPSTGYPGGAYYYVHPTSGFNDHCVVWMGHQPPTANNLCGTFDRARAIPADQMDPNALYVIFVGANDIQDQLGGALAQKVESGQIIDPYAKDPQAASVIVALANAITGTVLNLHQKGARYFMVVTLPNMGYTPEGFLLHLDYELKHADATTIYKLFDYLTTQANEYIQTTLAQMAATHPGITLISTATADSTVSAGLSGASGSSALTDMTDVNVVFHMARTWQLPDFPQTSEFINSTKSQKVSSDFVTGWQPACCANYYELLKNNPQNFPAGCKEADLLKMPHFPGICRTTDYGESPRLPDHLAGGAHFMFFNLIHPTSCGHRYLAGFFAAAVEGKTYTPPAETICQPK